MTLVKSHTTINSKNLLIDRFLSITLFYMDTDQKGISSSKFIGGSFPGCLF